MLSCGSHRLLRLVLLLTVVATVLESCSIGQANADLRWRRRAQCRLAKVPNRWHRDFWSGVRRGEDLSLENFHAMVRQLCGEQGKIPPTDGMTVLLREAESATGKSFSETGPQTMLRRDVAPSN